MHVRQVAGTGMLLLTIGSCCKDDCNDLTTIDRFEVRGFAREEVDTVRIISFQGDSTFSQSVDTFTFKTDQTIDADRNSASFTFEPSQNYTVEFPRAQRVYRISDITLGTKQCCREFLERKEYATTIVRHRVDGNVINGAYLVLRK